MDSTTGTVPIEWDDCWDDMPYAKTEVKITRVALVNYDERLLYSHTGE